MSLIYASEGEREMHHLKQKKLKSVLQYNLQEIERKRYQKDEQKNRFESSYQTLTHQAQESLAEENRKRSLRRQHERNMLKECYDRQIRERQERSKYDRIRDQQFYEKQREYLRYEEQRRMIDLQKMFNRVTYEAVPLNSRHRSKTEPSYEQQGTYNPEPNTVHLPNLAQKSNRSMSRPVTFSGEGNPSKVSLPPVGERPSLDDVKVETFQRPRGSQPRYLN